jgi:hypothetical protein
MTDEVHPIAIALYHTERGFIRGDFRDQYDEKCSIQESSLASAPCLWLGCDEGGKVHPVTGEPMGARMHLTQEMVAGLLPHLLRFVDTGRL